MNNSNDLLAIAELRTDTVPLASRELILAAWRELLACPETAGSLALRSPALTVATKYINLVEPKYAALLSHQTRKAMDDLRGQLVRLGQSVQAAAAVGQEGMEI